MKRITCISIIFFSCSLLGWSQDVWEKIGTDIADNTAAHSSTVIDSNGIPYTVLIEGGSSGTGVSGELTCKKFVDGQWVLVGDRGFSNVVAQRGYPSIITDQQNNIVVGHVMGGTFEARAYLFANNAWTELGTGISAGPSSFVNVAFDSQGNLYAAYCAGNSGGVVTVKKWNAVSASWVVVGTTVSAGNANYLRLVIDNSDAPVVAYADATIDNKLSVKKYNTTSGSWEYVGNAGFSSYSIPLETVTPKVDSYIGLGIDSNNHIYVAYRSLTTNKPIVERYSQNTWGVVGTVATASINSVINYVDLSIGVNNIPYLTYRDNLTSPTTYSAVVQKLVSDEWIPVNSVNGFSGTVNYFNRITVDKSNNKLYSTIVTGNKTQVYSISDLNIVNAVNASTLTLDDKSNILVASTGSLSIDATANVNKIIVKPGAKLSVPSSSTTLSGELILESSTAGTATLVDAYTTPTLSASVKQYVEASRNWYLSSPVSSALYSQLNKGVSVVEYNEPTATWVPVNAGNLEPGKGYIQVAAAEQGVSGLLEFSGLTNSGEITQTLSRTEGKGRGFNLVGNPYPSYLDWAQVATLNTNVLPTVWFRTKKTAAAGGGYTFATVNVASLSNPEIVSNNANTTINQYIPPMQAYWVRLIDNPATTDFKVTNTMRSHALSSGNSLKAPKATTNRPRIRLQLLQGQMSDETLIYFDNEAANKLDKYDSPKILNNSAEVPDLYTLIENERLVINGLNSDVNEFEIPLGFRFNKIDSLQLKVDEFNNFDSETKVYLLDLMLSKQTELDTESVYTFDGASPGIYNDSRFRLLFKNKLMNTSVESELQKFVLVYTNEANEIIFRTEKEEFFSIHNFAGQELKSGYTKEGETKLIGFKSGVYIVKVCGYSKKIVL